MKVAGEDEQSTARWYNWIAVFFVSVALVLISGNAGLIVERVTNCLIEAVSTQTQKHEHAVTLTSRPFAGNPSLLYQPVLGPSVPANPRPAWANSSSAGLRLPRFHGRKGANQFTKIAPGHPSGVQAKGVKRTWTEGSWRGPALDGPGF